MPSTTLELYGKRQFYFSIDLLVSHIEMLDALKDALESRRPYAANAKSQSVVIPYTHLSSCVTLLTENTNAETN